MSEPIEIVIESYLEDLIPQYLDNRRRDVEMIEAAVAGDDLEVPRSLGHQMKGSGGGYGFDHLSEIGAEMEAASKEGDAGRVRTALADLEDFLERVVVRYEDE